MHRHRLMMAVANIHLASPKARRWKLENCFQYLIVSQTLPDDKCRKVSAPTSKLFTNCNTIHMSLDPPFSEQHAKQQSKEQGEPYI